MACESAKCYLSEFRLFSETKGKPNELIWRTNIRLSLWYTKINNETNAQMFYIRF